MRFDIATLFPEMCETVVNSSIIGRGIKAGKLEVHCHQIRDYTTDKHRRTDLRLHGGGMGMLMTCQPIHDCWKAVCEQLGEKPYVIYLSPQGRVLTQAHAKELKEKKNLTVITNSVELASEICSIESWNVYMPGGQLRPESMALSGPAS